MIDHANPLPATKVLKAEAQALRRSLAEDGHIVGHGKSLELLARWYGYRDWNTLSATANRNTQSTLPGLGDRVTGRYLGQAFAGEVIGAERFGADKRRLTIRFDEPVDVVTFDSFSSFRHRVTATVGPDGTSPARTSNGRPQMELDLT